MVRGFFSEYLGVKFYGIGYSFGGVFVIFYIVMLFYNDEKNILKKFVVVYIFG